jgi:hypothetical protein
VWDHLPGSKVDSVFRLDHIQPVSHEGGSYQILDYRLSEQAIDVLEDWISWLRTGKLHSDGQLYAAKQLVQELVQSETT